MSENSRDPAMALANAGVRRELSASLGFPLGEEEDLPLLLLAWALLLALMLSQHPLSHARKHLSQALLDMDW